MYPEIAILSTLFKVSPTTIEREIRFLLPMQELIEWLTSEQLMNMANNWEHFPGGVAPVVAIDEMSLFVIDLIRSEL